MKESIKQIAKSNVLHFLLNKYIIFLIQFIKTLYLAVVLGPFYFGIWGFITLVLQYLSYTNIGVQFSLNVFLSLEDKNSKNLGKYLSSSLIIVSVVSVMLLLSYFGITIFNVDLFPKYQFSSFILFVIIITSLTHFNQVFINLYRSYGLLYKIAFSELLYQVSLLIIIFFFSGKDLLYALLIVTIFTKLISVLVFIIRPPLKIVFDIDIIQLKSILNKGFHLLMYNVSFYLIMLSSRTLVSYYYDVDIMGKYSFANRLAIATLMGLQTIGWIIFPKVINKLRSNIPDNEAFILVKKLRSIYLMILFFLSFTIIAVFPIFISFLEKYKEIIPVFIYLMLAQVVLSNNFGFNVLAISRHKENRLTAIGFGTIVINTIISLLFIKYFNLDYQYVGLAVFISVIFYNYSVVKYGLSIINQHNSFITVLSIIFPIRVFIPVLFILIITIQGFYSLNVIGLVVFVFLNYKKLGKAFVKGLSLFKNPALIKK